MFRTGNQLSGETLSAQAVRFVHAAPARFSAHAELFGVTPIFGARQNELVLEAAILGLPVTTFNSKLRDYFEEQCGQLAARFAADAPLAQRVQQELMAAMDGGDPSMDAISRRLGMSGRSLQPATRRRRSPIRRTSGRRAPGVCQTLPGQGDGLGQ